MQHAVDVLIPVYDGFEETLECINSVLSSLLLTHTPTNVIILFDSSPNKALLKELEKISHPAVQLIVNPQNMGFVATVNRGMRLNPLNDVILLNSDTIVNGNWIDRILSYAEQAPDYGTLTPFSNNAEICSWPKICDRNLDVSKYSISVIDDAFNKLGPGLIEIPTGVGFCMYIRRQCIDATGLFDEKKFGHGYGEENDFCRRAALKGYKHGLIRNVFVYHHGGVSFSEQKKLRVKNAMRIIDKLYPTYHALVAQHIAEDPAVKWRFAAELAYHQQMRLPLTLHISHGIGGGTDKHVLELIDYTCSKTNGALLTPHQNRVRLQFPNFINEGFFEFSADNLNELKNLLVELDLAKIHIHHLQGWSENLNLILSFLDVPYDVTLHDYYFIHPNPALTDGRGKFCADEECRDVICACELEFQQYNPIDWRSNSLKLLDNADRIFCPSRYTAQIYQTYFPTIQPIIAFHHDWEVQAPYPPVKSALGKGKTLKVVAIGALGKNKGPDVLESVAIECEARSLPIEFTLVGYAYRCLNPAVHTTGPYNDSELRRLLIEASPDLIWFPCTWPESYCYTLSASLDLGYPILAPNIGSFVERLANRPMTWIENWENSTEDWIEKLMQIKQELANVQEKKPWYNQPETEFSYNKDYVNSTLQIPADVIRKTNWDSLMANWSPNKVPPIYVSGFIKVLYWFNSHSFFSILINKIPYRYRKSVKRFFTTKPIHDMVA